MGLNYQMVLWNKHKKTYDKIVALGVFFYLLVFAILTLATNSQTSVETLVLRAFGSLALVLLHIILVIGPLSRINSSFLPVLYNRRHLGVTMFLAALIHGGFAIFQFHSLSNTNPIYSIFISNMEYGSVSQFPFQVLGFLALIIFFVMAATSHDFFLANLTAKVWKRLHMMVYLGYALLIGHIFLGAFQQETFVLSTGLVIIGFFVVAALHVYTGIK